MIPKSAKELFLEACELTGDRRHALIEQRCGMDTVLRDHVMSLLIAHDQAGGFLAKPAVAVDPSAAAPQQIGPYKILRVIGEGGFGTVYEAEQQFPVRRRVALKLIKPGMDSRQVIARFEAERQALAIMDHPNVAKVFDAGATDTSRPYFVMELVDGVPITQYCDQRSLNITQRLELFSQICQAVRHAHNKGVIHRDIKPSNILISSVDDRAVAKVIDFGIAKATQSRLTEKTYFTEFHQLIGTPEYMSPEQAEGSADIDTRTDVYSLGVLLYELLTGTTPFEARELRSKAYAEIQRVIRDVDPPKPSTRLSTMRDGLPSVAANRAIQPKKLNALVRGELDWIVMKCLEKERGRRYDSASALAVDIDHYLADEPVTAAAPSRVYQVRKFVRRNRLAVSAAGALLIVLIAGAAGTTIGLIGQAKQRAIADQQRIVAEQQRTEAQAQAREAKEMTAIADAVNQFQSQMLSAADPERLMGDKVTVFDAVNAAVKELDAGKLRDQPLIEGAVRDTIGATLRALGRFDAAEQVLRKGLELRRKSMPATHPAITETLSRLGNVLREQNKLDQAEPMFREALAINRTAYPSGSPEIAKCIQNLAWVLKDQGKLAEAEPLMLEALAIARKSLPADHPDLALTITHVALLLRQQGKYAEAEALFREAVEIHRKSLPPGHPNFASSLSNLALVLEDEQRPEEAEPLLREALSISRKALPAGHPQIVPQMNNLATALMDQKKFAEAEPLMREALSIRRAALPAGHPGIAGCLNNLAQLFRAEGKPAEAEPLHREALDIYRKGLPPGHATIGTALVNLGADLLAEGKPADAEALFREALAIKRAALPATHPEIASGFVSLALALQGQTKFVDAEAALVEAERLTAAGPPARHERCVQSLVALYTAWDKAEPSAGHDAQAAQWQAKLTEATTKSSKS